MNEPLNNTSLGEVIDDLSEAVESLNKHYEKEQSSISKHSPEFLEKPNDITRSIVHCKTCGNECTIKNIDGECISCSIKKLRRIETQLIEFNELKAEHKYCAIDGHREIYENKLHPDWAGKFVINGIELYPVFPLCKSCLDILSAYFVYFLEERGILRSGSGHYQNKFNSTLENQSSQVNKLLAKNALQEFINVASIHVLDSSEPIYNLYTELKDRRKLLLLNEQKGLKEWAEERKLKQPKNQVELLQLASKYYPCLKDKSSAKIKEKAEIEFLKAQPIPDEVLKIIELQLLNKLKEIRERDIKWQQLKLKDDQENQKLSWPLLKNYLNQEQQQQLTTLVIESLGQFANSVESILTEILKKYTLSELICKLITDTQKQET